MLAASLFKVTRTYGTAGAVSADIAQNCFTVLSGSSGSGKTSMLNLIGGIDQPDSGEITVAGRLISRMSDNELSDFRARHIGFIFQTFNLLPVLTAQENVEYPLTLLGVSRAQSRARAASLLDSVGLAGHGSRRPAELSGGQRQRVAIARALVSEPGIVLADEPTANLDSKTGAEILALMCRLQHSQATTFLFSSHDPQVLRLADHVIRIRDGRVGRDARVEALHAVS